MTTEFKVGQILVNSLRQFTKIVNVRNGIYGLTGWTASRESAEKSNVAVKRVNIYGLQYAGARVVKGGKVSAPETEENGNDTGSETPSKSSINALKADEARELAEKEGLSSEGNAKDVKARLITHFGL